MRLIIMLLLALLFNSAYSAINVVEFETDQQAERYQKLISELRCLVCQNQNLADSNAGLANDLKTIVQQKIVQGDSDEQILQFMTDRYGDFVLYRPPVSAKTLLLWLGPLLFLMLGLGILAAYIRKSKMQTVTISQQEQQRARQLLDERKE